MRLINRFLLKKMQIFFSEISTFQFDALKKDKERSNSELVASIQKSNSELVASIQKSNSELVASIQKGNSEQVTSIHRHLVFVWSLLNFRGQIAESQIRIINESIGGISSSNLFDSLRFMVREAAGLGTSITGSETVHDLLAEVEFIRSNTALLRPVLKSLAGKRVLYAGQAYYNAWYLSRALRKHGWRADVLNWDTAPESQKYYHGEDYRFGGSGVEELAKSLQFFVGSLYSYDIFHFSNAHGICFGWPLQNLFENHFGKYSEIKLLKDLGKIIVYSNNGCLDGVSRSVFAQWGPVSVCSICRWKNEPTVCSDELNLAWGKFRNSVADFQCTLGGNRVDYNDDPRVHEVPEFYCLDKDIWHPQIEIPKAFHLPPALRDTVRLYHAVGNKAQRTTEDGINIKCSHIYLPLIKKLKRQGLLLELLEPTDIPNKDVRFLMAQADIILDMLTFGWFGATAREAMMMGKPVICFIRPEWLASLRKEIPDYADELPIVNATPNTVEAVLRDLIVNPAKRLEIGQRCREFAVKWHSAEVGGRRFDEIYSKLLQGNPLLRVSALSESVHE